MKPADNPADPFKKALADATRTLADDAELSVTYSVDPPGNVGETMRLPQVSRRMTRDEVLLARGTADAFALRRRHHDDATFARFAPQGPMARDLYEAMEHARCEALGARDMPGTLSNIDAKIAHEAERKGYGQVRDQSEAPLSAAAGYLVRELGTGHPLPAAAAHMTNLWRPFIEEQAGGTLEGLADALADQAAFARLARRVIADLGFGEELGDDPDAEDDEAEDNAEQDEEDGRVTNTGDESDESEASSERSQEAQQDATQTTLSTDDMSDDQMSEDNADMPEPGSPARAARAATTFCRRSQLQGVRHLL